MKTTIPEINTIGAINTIKESKYKNYKFKKGQPEVEPEIEERDIQAIQKGKEYYLETEELVPLLSHRVIKKGNEYYSVPLKNLWELTVNEINKIADIVYPDLVKGYEFKSVLVYKSGKIGTKREKKDIPIGVMIFGVYKVYGDIVDWTKGIKIVNGGKITMCEFGDSVSGLIIISEKFDFENGVEIIDYLVDIGIETGS